MEVISKTISHARIPDKEIYTKQSISISLKDLPADVFGDVFSFMDKALDQALLRTTCYFIWSAFNGAVVNERFIALAATFNKKCITFKPDHIPSVSLTLHDVTWFPINTYRSCYPKHIIITTGRGLGSLKLPYMTPGECPLYLDLSRANLPPDYHFDFTESPEYFILPPGLTELNWPQDESAYNMFGGGISESLTYLDLSRTALKRIMAYFNDCITLKEVVLPRSVTVLDTHCFSQTALQHIDMTQLDLVELGDFCFSDCVHLKSVHFSTSLTSIGRDCFYSAGLTALDLNHTSLTRIGDCAFCLCKFTEVKLPRTTKYLGSAAFCSCSELLNIDLSDTEIETIEYGCFTACKELRTILFPRTLKYIEENAFEDCIKLEELNFRNTQVRQVDEFCYNGCDLKMKIYL